MRRSKLENSPEQQVNALTVVLYKSVQLAEANVVSGSLPLLTAYPRVCVSLPDKSEIPNRKPLGHESETRTLESETTSAANSDTINPPAVLAGLPGWLAWLGWMGWMG